MQPLSGKILASSQRSLLYCVHGTDADGNAAYYFIVVEKLKLPLFLQKIKAGQPFSLEEYGKIIESGYGAEPPAEVRANVLRQFDL
ncbi:MAG: hypothetical protein K0R63_433 [Rickettsiales bacterium]|jgi:hypothetical protein|nr:hypothetical protein [Rickettsiales bacterium]